MMAFVRLVAAVVCVLSCHVAHAADNEVPVAVVVRHAGTDTVGQALAGAIREAISGAVNLRLLETESAAPRIVLIVATVDGNVEEPDQQTAASINVVYDADTLPLNGYLVTALVQVCGITRTRECADEIIGTIEQALNHLRTGSPDLWQALQPQ